MKREHESAVKFIRKYIFVFFVCPPELKIVLHVFIEDNLCTHFTKTNKKKTIEIHVHSLVTPSHSQLRGKNKRSLVFEPAAFLCCVCAIINVCTCVCVRTRVFAGCTSVL